MDLKSKILRLSLLLNLGLVLIMLNSGLLNMIKSSNKKRITKVEHSLFLYDRRFYNFPKKTNIVMLGDSITQNIVWNDLLDRSDIANRGVGGNSTLDILNRLDQVYILNPQICFVMGGINDLTEHGSVEETFTNLEKIIEDLKQHHIIPIIQSTLFSRDTDDTNFKVFRLDQLLKEYCMKNSFEYLDLNSILSKDNTLIALYAKDQVHLNDKGYQLWGKYLLPVIKKYGF